jgi:hypothetical protein
MHFALLLNIQINLRALTFVISMTGICFIKKNLRSKHEAISI